MAKPDRPGVVFFVQDISQIGGSERQSLTLAKALHRRGIPVRVLSLTDGVAPKHWLGDLFVEVRGGVRVHRLPRVIFEPLASTLLARWSDWGSLYAVGSMLGSIAARLGQVHDAPVVVKLAGSGAWGDVATLQALAAGPRREVLTELSTTSVVCLTAHMEQEAREIGLPPTCLRRIPNGVDVDAITKARPVPLGDLPTVVYAGRLDPAKGVDVLLEAFARLDRAVTPARLILAGPGPERERLESRCLALGLGDHVEFLGARRDVPGILKSATVCCVPSLSEGMSNVLLECMAVGAAVVASDIPPNREVLGTGAGVLVRSNDPQALANALQRLLGDAEERERLGLAARERVQTFDLGTVSQAYAELLTPAAPPQRPGALRWAARFMHARGAQVRRLLTR